MTGVAGAYLGVSFILCQSSGLCVASVSLLGSLPSLCLSVPGRCLHLIPSLSVVVKKKNKENKKIRGNGPSLLVTMSSLSLLFSISSITSFLSLNSGKEKE